MQYGKSTQHLLGVAYVSILQVLGLLRWSQGAVHEDWPFGKYISKGGKITMIKSTLSSFSFYLMSILPLPRKVTMRLDKIQKRLSLGWRGLGEETPFSQMRYYLFRKKVWGP